MLILCRRLDGNALQGDLAQFPKLADMNIEQGSTLANNNFDCPLPEWAAQAGPCVASSSTSNNNAM
jgi:hypothetical protein